MANTSMERLRNARIVRVNESISQTALLKVPHRAMAYGRHKPYECDYHEIFDSQENSPLS